MPDWKDDLLDKVKELGWWAAVALIRWLLEQLVGNDDEEKPGADTGEQPARVA